MTAPRKAISLFAGAGGDTLGLERAGFTVVAYSENNQHAIATHQAAFPHSVLLKNPDTGSTDIIKIPDSVFQAYSGQVEAIFAGFPCFVAGTLVLTNGGYKPIETVTLQDKLLTHTGQFRPIVNLQHKLYDQTLFRVNITYHPTPIQSTSEHPFYVRERRRQWDGRRYIYTFGDPLWKPARALTADDFAGMVINREESIPTMSVSVKQNKYSVVEHIVPLANADQWFMMGYFVSNGWIENRVKKDGRSTYTIRFAVADNTRAEVIPRLQRVLRITDKKGEWGCCDATWFNILGEFGRYATDRRLPEWVQSAPPALITAFIAGYTDGRGNKRTTTTSPDLAFGLQRLYLKLGHLASVTVKQHDTYIVSVKIDKRRAARSFIEGNYAWLAITDVTETPTSAIPVYNFEVETDNSYVIENTVVHNCQGFSHAGKKRPNDKRNELVNEFARAARLIKPRWIIGENVRGLLSRTGHDPADPPTAAPKPVMDIIRRILGEAGYKITYKVVDVTEVGVPQLRKRLIIVGFRNSQWYPHITWPSPPEQLPAIRPLLESHLRGATALTVTCPDPRYLLAATDTAPSGAVHPNLARLAAGIRNLSSKEKETATGAATIVEPGGLISFGRRKSGYHGEVVDPDKPSKTIICTYNLCPRLFVGLQGNWVRTMSVRELAQIQGFPADFPWQGDEKAAITQIGNAVPPPLATFIGRALSRATFETLPQENDGDEGSDEED